MTRVTVAPLGDGWWFECRGHAGYAPKGQDIVCAGVSALCMALLGRLETLHDEGILRLVKCSAADGEACAEVRTDADAIKALITRHTFETVLAGFQALEEAYPEHVRVE